jgi:phosphoribosyl-ATP pyrophosphohydrolase
MAIQQDVMQELAAWLTAHREAKVLEKLLSEAPNDTVLQANQERAQAVVREAVTLLRAALSARGYSMQDLKAELRAS